MKGIIKNNEGNGQNRIKKLNLSPKKDSKKAFFINVTNTY